MAVKAKYRKPETPEQYYERILNLNLRGMSIESFQTTKSTYIKKKHIEHKKNNNNQS